LCDFKNNFFTETGFPQKYNFFADRKIRKMEVRKKKLSIVANRQILKRTNKNAIQSNEKAI
jgi:hypothetical protein